MSADIIARLEKATGPDRELDAMICCALHDAPDWTRKDKLYPNGNHGLYTVGRGGPGLTAPAYTASLDAALALVGERLPGWEIVIRIERDEKFANMWAPGSDPNFGGECFYSYAATPQIAVLLSMFRALETA